MNAMQYNVEGSLDNTVLTNYKRSVDIHYTHLEKDVQNNQAIKGVL